METLQEKVARIREEFNAVQTQEPRDEAAVNKKAIELHAAEDELKAAQISEQQIAPKITPDMLTIPRQYDFDVDFDKIYGTSILNKNIQALLDSLRESLHIYYMAIQEERDQQIRELRNEVDAANEQNGILLERATRAEAESNDYKKRFDNAGEINKELQDEVKRLKERELELLKKAEEAHILYPHKIINTGPTNLDGADAIRAQRELEVAARPKVWNLEWEDDLKRTNYKGIGEDGKEVVFSRLELGKYNVQVGPRLEQIAIPAAEVDEEVISAGVTEATFPDLPRIEAPDVPSGNGLDLGAPTENSPSVEERLAALEAHCFGYVKGAVA